MISGHLTSLWRLWNGVIFRVSAIVLPNLPSLLPYHPNLPPATSCRYWASTPSHGVCSLSNLECFDQFPDIIFYFFSFLLNALLTQKPCLPVALEESHCNEKRRSSINTTTCSAGTISYLLLNDLIGSEQGRKGVGRLFSWFWCGGAKCFPLRRFWTLLFVFVGILMGLNITGCIISFQCRNPTESFWKWALYYLPSHIPLQLSLFFIKTSTFIKFLC